MNIVLLHERVLYWCDRIASARFEPDIIDNAINVAINELVEEKYGSSKIHNRGDSFQRTQKVRDELYPLVLQDDTDTGLVLTGNLVTAASLQSPLIKYKYMLAGSAVFTVDTVEYTFPLWPLSYNMVNRIDSNPFRRPSVTGMSKVYYIESKNGILIIGPAGLAPDLVTIDYLAVPATVRKGIEIIGPFDFEEWIIISSLIATAGGETYQIGAKLKVLVPGGITLDTGLAVHDFEETDLPDTLHDELAIRAAINLLITAEMYDKVKVLESKIATS
jgi:hypothetical protein